jgi:hypothetical protein
MDRRAGRRWTALYDDRARTGVYKRVRVCVCARYARARAFGRTWCPRIRAPGCVGAREQRARGTSTAGSARRDQRERLDLCERRPAGAVSKATEERSRLGRGVAGLGGLKGAARSIPPGRSKQGETFGLACHAGNSRVARRHRSVARSAASPGGSSGRGLSDRLRQHSPRSRQHSPRPQQHSLVELREDSNR